MKKPHRSQQELFFFYGKEVKKDFIFSGYSHGDMFESAASLFFSMHNIPA